MVVRLKLFSTVIPKSLLLNVTNYNNLFILPVAQWNNTVCFANRHPEELMDNDRRFPFDPGRFPALIAQQYLC